MSIVKIANHAGVSTATVSRVLNNFPGVRAETVRQVRASLKALNYDPTQFKRARRHVNGFETVRRRTRSIAILTLGETRAWLQLPIMAEVVAGISKGAKECRFRLLLDEMLDIDRPAHVITNRDVDGAIVFLSSAMEQGRPQEALSSIARHLPIVWVMGAISGVSPVDHVVPNNQAVGYLALDYLKNQGCSEVAYMTLQPHWQIMRSRALAFAAAAHEGQVRASFYLLGKNQREAEVLGSRAVVDSDLDSLVDRLLVASPRPTGLFISNDAATVQIYPVLQRKGIRIGRDLSVISCDNEDIRLSGLNPRPASIDLGAEEAGWRAVHRLATRLENSQEPPVLISVAPKLSIPAAEAAVGA